MIPVRNRQNSVVDPLFWLGLSLLLVAVSLTAVLVAALPALQELSRAARSAEKLFDTLSRELPPTLESIRLTGMEINNLTDDVSEGVQSAGRIVQQLDQSLSGVKRQAKQAQVTTRSVVAGFKAAWKTLSRTSTRRLREGSMPPHDLIHPEPSDRLPADTRAPLDQLDQLDHFKEEYLPYGDAYHRSYSEEVEEDGNELEAIDDRSDRATSFRRQSLDEF
jgi:uncharacterized protein YoxC